MKITKEKDMEYKNGRMVQNTMDIGKMIKPMEKENYTMHLEIYMMENGKMIKLMEKEYICNIKAVDMKEIGLKMNNMVMDKKYGQMVQIIKDNILKGKNMEKEKLHL